MAHTGTPVVDTFELPDAGALLALRGRLASIRDDNGNELRFGYLSSGKLTNVVHTNVFTRDVSGQYTFGYTGDSLLESVTNGSWAVRFAYDANKRLISRTLLETSGQYAAVTNTTCTFKYYSSTSTPTMASGESTSRGSTTRSATASTRWCRTCATRT